MTKYYLFSELIISQIVSEINIKVLPSVVVNPSINQIVSLIFVQLSRCWMTHFISLFSADFDTIGFTAC